MTTLFDGRLAPLTYSIDFLDATPKKVARAVTRYFRGGPTMWGRATKLNGTLQGNLLKLQPLMVAARPKILLTSTALEGWTAMFDSHAHGHGVGELIAYLAGAMRTRGYYIATASPAANPAHGLGGCQFYVLGPEAKLGYIRTINLIENDADQWEFETRGEIQPYEDLEAYKRPRYVDRFTEQMLTSYATAVGLHP
ncbi:hypothetical protein AIF0345_0464 [Actinomyces israelii]|nr:hypothetical protein AIF0345_0464 [Actinomyces israelii]